MTKTNLHNIVAIIALNALVCASAAPIQNVTLCAGAAQLSNGSIVTIGQPFVSTPSATNSGASASIGLLPALIQNVSGSSPQVITTAPALVGGQFQLYFSTQPGLNYVVQASTNLFSWIPISTNAGAWTGFTYQDAGYGQFERRFYRVMIQ
jgi:hypothetical protein